MIEEIIAEMEVSNTTSAASERLGRVARGWYQRNLASGRLYWSDAELRGEARKWASHYARSRYNLLDRGGCVLIPAAHGRLVAVTEEERDLLRANATKLPSSWHIRKHWVSS